MWLSKCVAGCFPNFSQMFICKPSKFLETWKSNFSCSFQDFPDLFINPGCFFTSIMRRLGNLHFLSVLELICPRGAKITAAAGWTWNRTPDKSVISFSLKCTQTHPLIPKTQGTLAVKKKKKNQHYIPTLNSPQTLSHSHKHTYLFQKNKRIKNSEHCTATTSPLPLLLLPLLNCFPLETLS